MPRVDFQLWDRVYILKLICTAQATYSSFVVLVYIYLIILQSWTTSEATRSDIMKFKWGVIVVGTLEFGLGILLAFAANMTGARSRRRIIIWIISETFLIPISIFLLMQLHKRLITSNRYKTDTHYSRANIGLIPAQVCFLMVQYVFIAYAIDFLVQGQRKAKMYDPNIRPKSVYAPTDPKITTTESRHIRMSQSLLFQPSSSKALSRNHDKDITIISVGNTQFQSEALETELSEYVGVNWKGQENLQVNSPETQILRINENWIGDERGGMFQRENKKVKRKAWGEEKQDWKEEDWMKEEKTEWVQSEDREREGSEDNEKEWTEDEKEWRRDEDYWKSEATEQGNKDKDNKEYEERETLDWADLEEKKNDDTKKSDTFKA